MDEAFQNKNYALALLIGGMSGFDTYQIVAQRFADEVATGQLTIVNKAIVEGDVAMVDFYLNDKKSDWGTVLPDWNRSQNSSFRKVTVPAVQLQTLVADFGMPYYMKIDIEGADVYCLRSLLSIRQSPEHISLELMTPNNLKKDTADCLEILSCLRALGYTRFQISDQSRLRHARCPNPPQEGKFVDFQFDGFSSGPFGKELQTSVYSIDEVAMHYLDYFYGRGMASLLSRMSGKPSPFHAKGWFDVHASK